MSRHTGIWIPEDFRAATRAVMEGTITGDVIGEMAQIWQHNCKYLQAYSYDWWNYLDQPVPPRISCIRDALAAASWDRQQPVPYIQEGCARSRHVTERGGEAIAVDEYTSRCLKRAMKECLNARLRLQDMIQEIGEQMQDIRERLGRAGVVVEDHRVVALRARLRMMKERV